MTTNNLTLATAVKTAMDATGNITLNAVAVQAVKDSLLEFNIQADDAVDIKRLPPLVTDLVTFLEHLRGIKAMIEADNLAGNTITRDKNNQIEGKAPVYMLDGSLKRYKLAVCCLHAISAWRDGAVGAAFTGSLSQHAAAVLAHASMNPPANLGQGGGKLWNATFANTASRTKMFLAAILRFMIGAYNAPPGNANPNNPNPNQLPPPNPQNQPPSGSGAGK